MKRSALNKVSEKQAIELQTRTSLKRELLLSNGTHCMTCHDKNRDWRGLTLSHIIPLSRGGKTNKENCKIECFVCHELYEKHPERRV